MNIKSINSGGMEMEYFVLFSFGPLEFLKVLYEKPDL